MEKIKLLLYCTKSKPYLNDYRLFEGCNKYVCMNKNVNALNGKIVAECEFEVEKIIPYQYQVNYYEGQTGYKTKTLTFEELLKKSCLTFEKLDKYLYCDIGYAIHIKNLNIFDKAKELSDYKGDSKGNFFKIIEKAPQNMQMVLNEKLEDCILISIRPEWIAKILNKEKTIEVRKKVLKEMINNA